MQLSLHTTRFDQDIIVLDELPMPDRVAFKQWLLNRKIQPFFDAKNIEAVGYSTYLDWVLDRIKTRKAHIK